MRAASSSRRRSAAGTGWAAEKQGSSARPDWLRTILTVSGPAADVARLRKAAAGPAAIPWHLDLEHEELRLLAPMAGAGASARILARELRDEIAAHHARVLEAASMPGGACPFDLHRLVPIPDALLRLGSDAPASLAWLAEHWGTLQPLRQVRTIDADGDRRLRRSARWMVEFWSADWTPWQAIVRLRRNWPSLILHAQPDHG